MPILPTFTANVGDAPIFGGRRADAGDFGSGGLLDAGKTVREAASVFVAGREEDESRAALVASTEIRAKYAKALDDAALSGAPLEPLKESMNAELQRIGANFQTKRGADSLALYASNTNLMFDEQSNAIAVKRAGATARIEGSKFLNSTAAIIQRNPAYLAVAEKDAEAFGQTLRGISPEQRAEIVDGLKKELNQATAIAMSRLDPEGTKKRLEDGEWNLTPEGRNVALNKAETEIRAKRAEETYQREEKRRQEIEADQKAYDLHLKQILSGGGGKSLRRAIMDDQTLRPATREHLIEMMEQRAKAASGEERRSDQNVLRDLWSKAASGAIFTNDPIVAAVNRGQLSVRDASFLSSVVMAQKDENGRTFTSRLQGRIQTVNAAMRSSPVYQAQPELAAAIQMEMVAQVERRANELRKAGTSPDALLDPDSKDYYFTPNRIRQVADDLQGRARAAGLVEVDLRQEPNAWKDVPEGGAFVDPKGVRRIMTAAMKQALAKQGGPEFPIVLSGDKAFAEKPISEATRHYRRAMGLPVQGESR